VTALAVLGYYPLRRKACSGDSARCSPHRTSCSANPAWKGVAGCAGPSADGLGALGRDTLSALQGCLGPGMILEVLRCAIADGGGAIGDLLADLSHAAGDLASSERLDVSPRVKLVLRRFCHGAKVVARPDTTERSLMQAASCTAVRSLHAFRLEAWLLDQATRLLT
jgi:hypothetical protein